MDYLLLPALLSLSIQGVIGIISQIQHSRCTEIRGCGFECKREVPNKEEKPEELEEVNARQVV